MKKYVKIFATMAASIALIFGSFVSCGNSSDSGTSESNGGDSAGGLADANYIVTIKADNDYITDLEKDGSLNLPASGGQKFTYTLIAEIAPPNNIFTSLEMVDAVYGAEWEWELYYGKSITSETKIDLKLFDDIQIHMVKNKVQFTPKFFFEGKKSSNGEYTLLAKASFKKDGKTTLLGTGTIKLNVSGFEGI